MNTFLCPSDAGGGKNNGIIQHDTDEFYARTNYRANGGSRPIFATRATNDGMFMAVGPSARKSSSAPEGQCVAIRDVTDGTGSTILFGEQHLVDKNFDTFTNEAGWNSGSTIDGWSRWYPSGGDVGLGNIMCGAFAPINFQIPWAYGEPNAPTSQGQWYTIQDQRLSSIGSSHPGGAQVALTDGSVRFLGESMSQEVLTNLCVRDDGNPIGEF